MHRIIKSADCTLSPQILYEVVNDIDQYQYFLPGCLKSETLQTGVDYKVASLTLGKGPFQYVFATRNTLIPYESINLILQKGPFKTFEGAWRFNEKAEGCQVSFELMFSFTNSLSSFGIKQVVYSMSDHIVEAFIKRGHDVVNQSLTP